MERVEAKKTEAPRERAVLEAINKVFRERLRCKTEEELGLTCLAVAEELTGSKFGFIGELNAAGTFDTIAMSNPGWDACKVPPGKATLVIKDMPIRGIDRSTIKEGKSRIVTKEEFATHPDRVGTPEGHPELTAFLGVPLKYENKVIGMIGLGNKEGGYDEADADSVEALSVAIMEVLQSKRAEDKITAQAQEIQEISTPVVKIWDGVVVTPIIGMLDSQRTQQFMDQLLNTIVDTNSPFALIDITGVTAIDTQTAQHLIDTINAAKLLGARVILTGLSPEIAQTIVHLGIHLAEIETMASLSGGLRLALKELGYKVIREGEGGREDCKA